MRFVLTIGLDNAEAVDFHPDALADYLQNVSRAVRAGHGSGNIRDGNGNTIGQYDIGEDPDENPED